MVKLWISLEKHLHPSCNMFFVLFQVSVALLMFCSIYMFLFLEETVNLGPKREKSSSFLHGVLEVIQTRYKSMRYAATIVVTRYS